MWLRHGGDHTKQKISRILVAIKLIINKLPRTVLLALQPAFGEFRVAEGQFHFEMKASISEKQSSLSSCAFLRNNHNAVLATPLTTKTWHQSYMVEETGRTTLLRAMSNKMPLSLWQSPSSFSDLSRLAFVAPECAHSANLSAAFQSALSVNNFSLEWVWHATDTNLPPSRSLRAPQTFMQSMHGLRPELPFVSQTAFKAAYSRLYESSCKAVSRLISYRL